MHQTLLDAYDIQLRTTSEMSRESSIGRHGPLWFAVFPGGHGFVTYASLDGADEDGIAELADAALQYFDAEIWAMEEMQGAVFGDPNWRARAEATLADRAVGADRELWIALVDGEVVSAGRLEPVGDTDFAGPWGGATLPEWRARGIYRALTARRAHSALLRGKKYLNADCTEFSRPILDRSGLIKVSATTPYLRRQSAV